MRIVLVALLGSCVGCGDDTTAMSSSDLSSTPADLAVAGCAPRPIGSFQPMFVPPTAAHQNRCTSTQIGDGVAALANGTFSTFASQNADCAACLVTPSTAASALGPLENIAALHIIDGNRDGCVALLTGDASASSCAAKVQATGGCIGRVVRGRLPDRVERGPPAYNDCGTAATQAGAPCGTYAAASSACIGSATVDGGGSISGCFLGSQGVVAWFTYLGTLFCGA